ncbi:acyl-CoA thioesterase [Nocardia sp. NPDC005366]|uniref:acyl-CoA thioesterase n=1 Tax=Nocardia sp. NPDC005366 TaxID=3156878 RepID=UPI0033A38C7C
MALSNFAFANDCSRAVDEVSVRAVAGVDAAIRLDEIGALYQRGGPEGEHLPHELVLLVKISVVPSGCTQGRAAKEGEFMSSGVESVDDSLSDTTGRPHPARSRVELYPVIGRTQARYTDMDPNAHLNNLALESLHEDARAGLTARVFPGVHDPGARQVRLVTSQNVVHFLAEAHWPAVIETGVGIGRVGRTSFVASSALFRDGICLSICDTVLVAVGDDGPVPIVGFAREMLQELRLRASSISADHKR